MSDRDTIPFDKARAALKLVKEDDAIDKFRN